MAMDILIFEWEMHTKQLSEWYIDKYIIYVYIYIECI